MPIEIAYDHAPNNSGESFKRYVEHKVPTGGFLRALLENDLREAFGRADYINVGLIQAYVSWMYNNLRLHAMSTNLQMIYTSMMDLCRVIDSNVPKTAVIEPGDLEQHISLLRGCADFVGRSLPQLERICQGVLEVGRLNPLYKDTTNDQQ